MELSARAQIVLILLLCLSAAGMFTLLASAPKPEGLSCSRRTPDGNIPSRPGAVTTKEREGSSREEPNRATDDRTGETGTARRFSISEARARRGRLTESERECLDGDLLTSAYVGSTDEVSDALVKGADPNARDLEERTPLHLAALRGDDGTVVAQALIKAGARLDVKDSEDLAPMDLALVAGKAALALLLVRNGAPLPPPGGASWELYEASDLGNAELVEILLARGQDPNWTTVDGWNALCRALEAGHVEIASVLEKAGAYIPSGKGPNLDLLVACRKGDVRLASRALDRGADLNVFGPSVKTPVEIAVDLGHRHVLELLAARGTPVDGAELLIDAALAGHVPVVEFLLDRGGDVNTRVPNPAVVVALLHIAAANGYRDLAAFLLSRGAAVDVGGPGETPLHDAVDRGHASIVRLLLDHGADFHSPDGNGRTPLHKAVAHPPIVKMLLAGGAKPDPRDCFGETPLHLAVIFDSGESAGLLLKAGADIDARDDDGETPLVDAVRDSHPDKIHTVRFLLEQGADVNLLTGGGRSALDYAKEEGNEKLVRLLLSYGAK